MIIWLVALCGVVRLDMIRTACSACCWKWTNATVETAKSDVPRRVSLDARDIIAARKCSAELPIMQLKTLLNCVVYGR